MPVYTDSTGFEVELIAAPKRIVSLVPSQTELLAHLELNDEVIGITKFCIHPAHWFHHKTRIGGTKMVKVDEVLALKPDLILANKEENIREQVEALRLQAPVYTTDVNNLDDALAMIKTVGALTHQPVRAAALIGEIGSRFAKLNASLQRFRVAYLIWKNPYMAAGAGTFIHDMLDRCGFENCLATQERYPSITAEELVVKNPELVLLSSEPFPFKEQHIQELQNVLPNTRILLVNGEYFSWYGSRLVPAADYFQNLVYQINAKL